MNNTLIIDTTNSKQIKVGIILDEKEDIINHEIDKHKSQIILPLIDKILKKNHLKLNDLTKIQINPGPGSFTGIRVGLTIANTLAALLKIPINDKPIGQLAEPEYSS